MKFTVNESNKVKHRKQKVLVYTNIDIYISFNTTPFN